MKNILALGVCLLVGFFSSQAQLLIGQAANFTSGNVTISTSGSVVNQGRLMLGPGSNLYLAGQGSLSSLDRLNIPNLYMLGSDYSIAGTVFCQESLRLKNGTLSPESDAKLVVDWRALVVSENEAHVNGRLYHAGETDRFYPIGKNGVYAPVTLLGVTDERQVGVEAFNQDLGIAQLPADIAGASPNWYWEISAHPNFEGAVIQLPVSSSDASLIGPDGKATILQTDLNGEGALDLGRNPSSDFLNTTSELLAVGPYVLLGFASDLKPVIHNIITPRNDDKNPFLIIDRIDALPENEVILLDRWGQEVFREKNFTNYSRNGNAGRPYNGAFDGLPSGNYICLLKYQGTIKKQVVTVLEE